jgi:hypothetical protein
MTSCVLTGKSRGSQLGQVAEDVMRIEGGIRMRWHEPSEKWMRGSHVTVTDNNPLFSLYSCRST